MKSLLSHVKPFFFTALLLLGLELIIAFTPLNRTLEDWVENPLTQKFYDLQTHNPKQLDVLMLGTSRTNNGFSPEAFEAALGFHINSYNLGLPATQYGPLTGYLMDHVTRYGQPKLVLLEVSDFMLNPGFYSYNSTLYFQTLTDHRPEFIPALFKTPLLTLSDKKHIVLSTASRLFRYRTVLSPIYLKDVFLQRQPMKPKLKKGWEPRKVDPRMLSAEGIQNSADNEKQFALSQFNRVELSQIRYFLDYCKQQQIPVMLVEWPNHPEYLKRFEQSGKAKLYHQAVAKLVLDYHLDHVDLNKNSPSYLEGLYANTRHLSEKGATVYTKQLAEQITRLPGIVQTLHTSKKAKLGI